MAKEKWKCSKCKTTEAEQLYAKNKRFSDDEIWLCLSCYEDKHGSWEDISEESLCLES